MTDLPGLAALLADPLLGSVLSGRREGVLLLDYDGTLAPLTPDRDAAVPYPGLLDILSRLPRAGSGRAVVVSGRPIEAIEGFLGPAAPAEIWGCHGALRRLPDGRREGLVLSPQWAAALDRAAAAVPGELRATALEPKPVSLALHWRGLPEEAVRSLSRHIEPVWFGLAREAGLELHGFDGGLELRPPGWDKGRAVRCLAREQPGAVLVYCGDDRTDEDAFTALGPDGLGILVRLRWRPTAARYHLTPPGELSVFLDRIAAAFEGGNNESGR
ncbi:MAG: trehalose-phosphatase [Desulfovibrionaceae bacterium]